VVQFWWQRRYLAGQKKKSNKVITIHSNHQLAQQRQLCGHSGRGRQEQQEEHKETTTNISNDKRVNYSSY